MRSSLVYSTFPDQRARLGVETEQLTYALVLGLVGVLFGPILSSVSDRLNFTDEHAIKDRSSFTVHDCIPVLDFKTGQISTSAYS